MGLHSLKLRGTLSLHYISSIHEYINTSMHQYINAMYTFLIFNLKPFVCLVVGAYI